MANGVDESDLISRTGPSAYELACRAAIEDVRHLTEQADQLRERLSDILHKIAERRNLVDNLLRVCTEEQKKAIQKEYRLALKSQAAEIERGGSIHRETLRVMSEDTERSWSANEIQDRLIRLGLKRDPKAVFNAVQRLAHKGLLVRVERGRYRVPEYGIGIVTTDILPQDQRP